jgi:hypothetical protein
LAWRWTARRLAISAFVVFHLSALIVWTNPPCALKERFAAPFRPYMLPLGLWQWWAIFAPEPVKENTVLEAEIIDAKGLRHIHEFTKIGDLPWWAKMPRYRNPKFTNNMTNPEYAVLREFAARHAVRRSGLGAEAFPVSVSLYTKAWPTPPVGTATADPMAPPRIEVIERFQFPTIGEVRP